jgi:phosphohistidine phosphatase
MHHIFLLRHAKSSWDQPDLDDHDRPLAPRGTRTADRMARQVSKLRPSPTLVLCSSAVRARQTMEPAVAALGDGAAVLVEDGLYSFDAQVLLDRLRVVPEATNAVLLVGHNPAMQDLTLRLAAGGGEAALARARQKFPTGALAALRTDGPWGSLGDGRAVLLDFVAPRNLD